MLVFHCLLRSRLPAVGSRCTRNTFRAVSRLENEAVLDRMDARMARNPGIVRLRHKLVEHPFGSIKQWTNQGASSCGDCARCAPNLNLVRPRWPIISEERSTLRSSQHRWRSRRGRTLRLVASDPRRQFSHSLQEFRSSSFRRTSCRAPQSACRKDSLPLRRLESTTMSDSGWLRISAQIVDLEQWCILG